MPTNPYEQLYKGSVQKISASVTMKQAEQMTIQMSMIYNAFGLALKDLVSLLSVLYSNRSLSENTLVNQKIKQIKEENSNRSNQSQGLKINNQQKISENEDSVEVVDFQKYALNLKKNQKNIFQNQKKSKLKDQITKSQNTYSRQSKPVERIETVRGKKQRQTLNGYSCTMCDKFYKLFDVDFTDSNGTNKMCNNCSRHRSNLPPTNFFNDFSQQFELDD